MQDSNRTSLYIRIPYKLKDRLTRLVEQLNTARPGANYSLNSLVVAAIERLVSELEEELKQQK